MPEPIPLKVLDDRTLGKLAEMLSDYLRRSTKAEQPIRRVIRGGGGHKVFPFTLTEDLGSATASANRLEWDFSTVVEAITVTDNGGIFADGTSGSKGIAVKIASEYHIIQLACGS